MHAEVLTLGVKLSFLEKQRNETLETRLKITSSCSSLFSALKLWVSLYRRE